MIPSAKWEVLRHFWKHGAERIRYDAAARRRTILAAGSLALLLSVRLLAIHAGALTAFVRFLNGIAGAAIIVPGVALWVIVAGTPKGFFGVMSDIQRIGLKNAVGELPVLVDRRREGETAEVLTFLSHGVPLTQFEDFREKLESALNVSLVDIRQGADNHTVELEAVPASGALPALLRWSDNDLDQRDFVLCLGRGLTGIVTVDLAVVPHILLGGSTGSGKSILLKLLIMEAIQKGAEVCVADFKGGVDYPAAWQTRCRFCFDEPALLCLLDELADTLQQRKQLFRDSGCADLREYNAAAAQKLPRCVFACDEVAEVLDKTGAAKERREQIGQIETRLATIARQGRAFGLHLILATQRPDANILAGQIRNNIDCRICGRADTVLSQIILDSTDAADRIPKTARGRFLLHDGTIFQAFLPDEAQL